MLGINSGAHLVARVILGYIFVMHGWQKLSTNGIDATKGMFDQMGVPAPDLAAYYATWVELIGGVLLIVGLALPLVAILLIADMIGAIFYAHIDHGLWSMNGGYEFPLALIAGLIAVGFVKSGPAAIDHYILPSRRAQVS
ncbi:DoxX family membrane protein [Gordonia amarae]|uniref:DoxX family protein n=2 Tax=Gordonia amarae TaxID=36821 RepID=G7GK35_9ACTN|nr:DoxX family protein [Gordonia amarae]MCS3879819.1 putative oxidoreductase [Gordonia amarae]QHN18239.1 DoxX family membrane protein [Gordonia amarae]QHN22723.1 DoxX family membrane protein [Gordonia amarae]QHN31626.1 DoxX family membrane protein [Gordonia amarae]QHN40370.1 DoxX family membrane protein [Gordonia amarae]